MSGSEIFRAPAEAYDRFVGRYGAELASGLIALCGVRSGMSAVDVGCGPGALTAALAEQLGAGSVRAADPSDVFVAACRRRAPGVDVVVASAEALPFANDSFDAALSQLVVNFMTDARAGVCEMARVTRPGGVVCSCVWDYAGGMTLLRTFWDAAREVDDAYARADEGSVMRWCREGDLAALWRDAGLSAVADTALEVTASYEDFDDLWNPFLSGVGPAGAFCQSLEDQRRIAVREAMRRRLDVGDGPFELTARAWAVTGTA